MKVRSEAAQDKSQLYLRNLDQFVAEPIPGTEGGISPFLSPDNQWIGFWAGKKLWKVAIDGGIASPLCNVDIPFGFSWGPDEQIVFSPMCNTGLWQIPAKGGVGKAEALTKPDAAKGEFSHRLPHHLPNGKGILFTVTSRTLDMHPRCAVLETKTGKWHTLGLDDCADVRYLFSGHLAFLRQGTLWTIPFDQDTLETAGEAKPIIPDISQAMNTENKDYETGAGEFCISASGSLAYATGGILKDPENLLVWVDQKGNEEPETLPKDDYFAARLSPDGNQIAYVTLGMEKQVWIYDRNRGVPTRLTSEGIVSFVAWASDAEVLFGWGTTGTPNIFRQAIDRSSPMKRLTPQSEYTQRPSSISPNGQMLAFVEDSPSTGWDIMLCNLTDGEITPLLNTKYDEMHPEFSPDGRWLAYSSNESDQRTEVYVRPFPGPGPTYQVSGEGGSQALWARDQKQLFYRRADQVWAVDVQSGPRPFGKPRRLFENAAYARGTGVRAWGISRDGRFLMVKREERQPRPIAELVFVQNWLEEVRSHVPRTKK